MHLCQVKTNFLVTHCTNHDFVNVPIEENGGDIGRSCPWQYWRLELAVGQWYHNYGVSSRAVKEQHLALNFTWHFIGFVLLYLMCKFVWVLQLNKSSVDKKLISSFMFPHHKRRMEAWDVSSRIRLLKSNNRKINGGGCRDNLDLKDEDLELGDGST